MLPLCLTLALALRSAAQGGELQALSADQPIHDAARVGSGADVVAQLKSQPASRDQRTQQGSTPLHLAATNPDTGALQALIAAGADCNARDLDGLHRATVPDR